MSAASIANYNRPPNDFATGSSWFSAGKLVVGVHGHRDEDAFEVTGTTRSGLPLVRRRVTEQAVVYRGTIRVQQVSVVRVNSGHADVPEARFNSPECVVRFGKEHGWSVLVPRSSSGKDRYYLIEEYKEGDILRESECD
jgi:hypothetical protein